MRWTRFEIDGRQRDPGLDAPLQLQQLDLKIDRGSEVRLLFLQAAKLDDFSRFGPRLLSFGHGRIVTGPGAFSAIREVHFSFEIFVSGESSRIRWRRPTAGACYTQGFGRTPRRPTDRWQRNVLLLLRSEPSSKAAPRKAPKPASTGGPQALRAKAEKVPKRPSKAASKTPRTARPRSRTAKAAAARHRDGCVGDAPVRDERRPLGSRQRAVVDSRPSRPHGHRHSAPVPPRGGVAGGCHGQPDAAPSRAGSRRDRGVRDGAASADGELLSAPGFRSRVGRFRRRPRALRSRRALWRRSRRLSRQRVPVRRVQPGGARVHPAPRSASVGHSRARLAGGAGAGLSEDAVFARPDRRRRAGGLHDPQPRVPGALSERKRSARSGCPGMFSTSKRWSSTGASAISRAGSISASASRPSARRTPARCSRRAMGFGFEGILARRSDDLVGILNGIDTDRWNPSTDPFVTAHYSAEDLSGKRAAKRQLLESSNLDVSRRGTAAAAHRPGLAPDRSEGIRPDRRGDG